MKKWRFLAFTVLSLMLWCGVASGDVHYEGLTTYGGKIYALISEETASYPNFTYYPSKIAEYDKDLNELRRLELKDGEAAAKNSEILALHGGKLYVGSNGGALGDPVWGDVWEVDIATWAARHILDVSQIGVDPYAGIAGLAIADDGTAFLLTGGYDASWNFRAMLFVTTVDNLSTGNVGTGIPITPKINGYSWGIAWSEFDQTLWVAAGTELHAYSESGIETFTPLRLGNNIGSIAALGDRTGLIYTASDYVNTSVGGITKTGSAYTVQKDLLTNLTGDAAVFAFKDHNGNARVFLREYNYGANDFISIYNPNDFSKPIINVSDWGSNIHAITTLGNYLYYGTYEDYDESGDQLSGKLGRIDMSAWPGGGNGGGDYDYDDDGGGCDSGFGVTILLLLIPAVLINYRKR